MKKNTSFLSAFLFVLLGFISFTQVKATPLSVTITAQTNVSCNGGTNGSATAIATGGTSPYTYAWSTSPRQYTATATGLSAGTYTVGVADANFATATISVTITQPAQLTSKAIPMQIITCNGGSNGIISSVASGGISPYTYLWSPLVGMGDTATGVSAGCYTMTVTDHNGCTATSTVCLSQPAAINIGHSSTPDSNCVTPVGTIIAKPSGGTSPYTYLWSGGQTSATATGLSGGTYTCTVTDNNGCTASAALKVAGPVNNFTQPICIITLDTSINKCKIVWGRTNSPPAGGSGHFNIYKDTNSNYVLIHSQPLNALSEFTDSNSYPFLGIESYRLSTVDSCGESALSPIHSSIYLTATAGYNVYILNWTAYFGFTPSKYIILRGPSLNKLGPIDSVASNVLTFHDTLPPLGSYYVIEAVNPNGPCVPTTHNANASFSLYTGSFSNGFNSISLGVTSLSNNLSTLKIYPNPTNGMFTLNYSMSGSDHVVITIYNELGQQVYTLQKEANNGLNTQPLNVANLASGIYTLRIQTSKGYSVQKLSVMQR